MTPKKSLRFLGFAYLLLNVTQVSADPVKGQWSSLKSWPVLPIHSVLSSSGELLTFGAVPGSQADSVGGKDYDVWNPNTNSHNTVAQSSHDYFCAANVTLPSSGNVLIAGGDDFQPDVTANDFLSLYDPSTQTLTSGSSMNSQRWYPTATVLSNGEVLVTGGTYDYKTHALTPEIYNENTGWRELTGATSSTVFGQDNRYFYPRVWAAPNGKAFGIAQDLMFWIDPKANNGKGSIQVIGQLPNSYASKATSTAVMYAKGKILQVGGGVGTTSGGKNALNSAIVIDINGSTPKVTPVANMKFKRHWADATVLPNGQVLVNGGSTVNNQNEGVAYVAEIWDPTTGKWTSVASEDKPRLYHASSVLLQDGRIFSGGGGNPGPTVQHNAQFYTPPYLFDSNGNKAKRPEIEWVQSTAGYNTNISTVVSSGQDITRVTLVRTSSTTHSFNMDQRFVELNFTQSGQTLSVKTPANNLVAPPGFYLLSVINNKGVVSKSSILKIGDFNITPTVPKPITEIIKPPAQVNNNPPTSKAEFIAQLQSVATGYCVEITNASQSYNANADSAKCGKNAANQRIYFFPVNGKSNTYTLKMEHSGMCLAVINGTTKNGDNIVQQDCNNSPSQQYKIKNDGAEKVIYTGTSSNSLVVDSSARTDNIQQWQDYGNGNQRWTFFGLDIPSSTTPVKPVTSTPTPEVSKPPTVETFNGRPVCVSSTDTDNDGWGWENETSCIFPAKTTQAPTQPQAVPVNTTPITNSSGTPVCVFNSDSDNDGWGWENGSSCIVKNTTATTTTVKFTSSGIPLCMFNNSDQDKDGWGWENNKSCVTSASVIK